MSHEIRVSIAFAHVSCEIGTRGWKTVYCIGEENLHRMKPQLDALVL